MNSHSFCAKKDQIGQSSKFRCLCTFILFSALMTPGFLIAGSTSYICEIDDFQSSHQNPEVMQWVGERAMETPLEVDRVTGRIIHPVLGTTSFNSVRVLNFGSDEWSFTALADSGNGGHIVYIEIAEFTLGSQKPFVAVSGGIAYWGNCI